MFSSLPRRELGDLPHGGVVAALHLGVQTLGELVRREVRALVVSQPCVFVLGPDPMVLPDRIRQERSLSSKAVLYAFGARSPACAARSPGGLGREWLAGDGAEESGPESRGGAGPNGGRQRPDCSYRYTC